MSNEDCRFNGVGQGWRPLSPSPTLTASSSPPFGSPPAFGIGNDSPSSSSAPSRGSPGLGAHSPSPSSADVEFQFTFQCAANAADEEKEDFGEIMQERPLWCRCPGEDAKKRQSNRDRLDKSATQLIGVVRHTERADSLWSAAHESAWQGSEDFAKFPTDPPLSANGLVEAQEIGQRVYSWAQDSASVVHLVISSPYMRCVQTATEICKELGPSTRLLIDCSLSEVHSPDVLGDAEPRHITRPLQDAIAYAQSRGVNCKDQSVGRYPVWPETLRSARWRFAQRFLAHLHRSLKVRRNCIIVSHAECVGVALSMMPSQVESGRHVAKVEFGGMFLARRQTQEANASPRPPAAAACSSANASPSSSSLRPSPDNQASSIPCSPFEKGLVPFSKAELQRLRVSEDASEEPSFSALFSTGPELGAGSGYPAGFIPPQSAGGVSFESVGATSSFESVPFERGISFESVGAWSPRSGEAFEDGDKCHEPPKVSDGWHVQTYNVNQAGGESRTGAVLERRMQALAEKGSYSRDQLELLLGQLSDSPLEQLSDPVPCCTDGSGNAQDAPSRSEGSEQPKANSHKRDTSEGSTRAISKGSSKVHSCDDLDVFSGAATEGMMSDEAFSVYKSEDSGQSDTAAQPQEIWPALVHEALEQDLSPTGSEEWATESVGPPVLQVCKAQVVLGGSFNSRLMMRRRSVSKENMNES